MKQQNTSLRKLAALSLVGLGLLSTSCKSLISKSDDYAQPAHRPQNPGNVVVKVSLSKQMVYVMEGKTPLFVTATCVGTKEHPTPKGRFTVTNKIKEKRSGTYGFAINNKTKDARPAKSSWVKGGEHYVGHPMPNWIEFCPGYGFHTEWVWPVPRSHGCLRVHRNDSCKLWELTRIGTPVIIADSFPEDDTIGKNVPHPGPEHYNTPEPAADVFISPNFFKGQPTAKFVD